MHRLGVAEIPTCGACELEDETAEHTIYSVFLSSSCSNYKFHYRRILFRHGQYEQHLTRPQVRPKIGIA